MTTYAERIRIHGFWAIGAYAGETPLGLGPSPNLINPGLTFRGIPDPEATFVADPFMVPVEDGWYLFFELKCGGKRPGTIAYAYAPDNRLQWQFRDVILSEPFHLSYPHVFQHQGVWYMTPETLDAENVRLYRADAFPGSWKHIADLVPGRLADPTPFQYQGRWWMFVCTKPHQHDTLALYHAEHLEGPWMPHPANPIVRDDARIGRPAGRIVEYGDRLIRFSQDCRETYGKQVFAIEIEALTANTYRERIVGNGPYLTGKSDHWPTSRIHHVDAHQLADGTWLACVDGLNIESEP